MADVPLVDGPKVMLGGREWILAPLNLRAVKKAPALFEMLNSTDLQVRLDAFTQLLHGSLVRNYPELTLDQVDDMVTMGDIQPLVNTIMRISGMVRTEGSPGGAATSDPSIGMPSIGNSSTDSGGHGST